MAVFDDTRPWNEKLLLYPHRINWENNIPVPDKAEAESVTVLEDEPLKAECAHFLHCVQHDKQPVTDGEEGLRVLKVLNAAQRCLDVSENGQDCKTNTGVHASAIVEDTASIGDGTTIWHFSHILSGTTIGKNCKIGQNVVAGPNVSIGSGCKIQNNVSVYQGVTLEDDVFCGPSMVFKIGRASCRERVSSPV